MAGRRVDSEQYRLNPIAWLRSQLRKWGLERFARRYYGVYPGRVIDVSDDQNRYRIRATCPAIGLNDDGDVPDDYWMLPNMPGMGTDIESGVSEGLFFTPDIGSNIWVQFQYGDPAFPIYTGGWITNKNTSDTFEHAEQLRKGIRTRSGHYIRLSDDSEDLHVMIGKGDGDGGPSPMFLSMDKNGSLTMSNEVGSLLYMNAEKPETSMMTANDKGEVTSLLMLGDDKVTISTKSGGAIGIDGKDIVMTGDNVTADCSQEFIANAGSVKLGKGAMEPAVRGMKLLQWSLIHQHVITTPVPGSPTGPGPTPPMMLYKELSEVVFLA